MEMRFYRCSHCGNIIVKLEDSGVPVICCGEAMVKLLPGTSDGAHEKHVPVMEQHDGHIKITVGSVEHPMLPAHHIQWIVVVMENGYQVKFLQPNTLPVAEFEIPRDGKVVAVYEYCNLHGLWKAE